MDPSESKAASARSEAHAYPTPWQRKVLWTALVTFAVAAMLAVAGVVFWGFIQFLSWSYPIVLPLGLSVIIGLVLDPVVTLLQRWKIKRSSATLFVCALAVVAFIDFWTFLLPPLVSQAAGIISQAPDLIETGIIKVQNSLDPESSQLPPTSRHARAAANAAPKPDPAATARAWVKNNLSNLQGNLPADVAHFFYAGLGPVGQALGVIFGFGFVPIYVYYFLADEDYIAAHWKEWVPLHPGRLRDEVTSVLGDIGVSLVNYFRGQIIVSATDGVLLMIGLTAIGIPSGLVLGFVAGVFSIVPYLGIIISIIPALLLAYTSANGDPTWSWLSPVLVLVVFAAVQGIESMIVTPRVQSHTTGLHPLIIILGILLWSMLLPGLLGPIVAIPLTCAVVVLVRRYVTGPGKVRAIKAAG